MTKNEMNYDEQQHQVVRGRDDIKVGDKVSFRRFFRRSWGTVMGVRGKEFIIHERSKMMDWTGHCLGDQNRFYKKYRWQLFKINN